MTSFFKPLLIVSLLAAASVSVQAQGMGMGGPQSGPMGQHQRMDPARMQEIMAKRQADLKAKLALTPAQEGAWTAYTTGMQPAAGMAMRQENRQAMHDSMSKHSTPERIDHMNAMKAQRDAEMAKRNDATKTFYAALTPEQQQVFDTNAMVRVRGAGHGGPGKHAPQKSGHATTLAGCHVCHRDIAVARLGIRPASFSALRWPAGSPRQKHRRPAHLSRTPSEKSASRSTS